MPLPPICSFIGMLQGDLTFILLLAPTKLQEAVRGWNSQRLLQSCTDFWSYKGADKSLAQPGRKKANVSVRMT